MLACSVETKANVASTGIIMLPSISMTNSLVNLMAHVVLWRQRVGLDLILLRSSWVRVIRTVELSVSGTSPPISVTPSAPGSKDCLRLSTVRLKLETRTSSVKLRNN